MAISHILTESYIYKNYIYVFNSVPFEPKEQLNKRAWFIIKYIHDNKLNIDNNFDIQDIIKKSYIYSNELHSCSKY